MSPLTRLRQHRCSPLERAIVIAAIAIVMASLFLTTYSLALGDPVPRHIDAALMGDPGAHAGTVAAVENVSRGKLVFRRYPSLSAALQAINEQRVMPRLI